eukprot:363137-Chlamydomonas_euryale.AAC.5
MPSQRAAAWRDGVTASRLWCRLGQAQVTGPPSGGPLSPPGDADTAGCHRRAARYTMPRIVDTESIRSRSVGDAECGRAAEALWVAVGSSQLVLRLVRFAIANSAPKAAPSA